MRKLRNRLAIVVSREALGDKPHQWAAVAAYDNVSQAIKHYNSLPSGGEAGKVLLCWDMMQGVTVERVDYLDTRYGGNLESVGLSFHAFRCPDWGKVYVEVYDAIADYIKGS